VRGLARAAAFAFALALAAGCLGRAAPRDRYFRLVAQPPPRPAGAPLPGTLAVERLRADALVRGTALLVRDGDGSPELRRRDYAHWVDSPTLLVQRATVDALRAAGVAERVVTSEQSGTADRILEGELLRFEEVRDAGGSRAVVEIEVTLVDGRRGRALLDARYHEEAVAAGDAPDAVARAFAAALSAALAELARDVAAVRP
jgi:ABC-type uncharacterized transport system auxiliary subunit